MIPRSVELFAFDPGLSAGGLARGFDVKIPANCIAIAISSISSSGHSVGTDTTMIFSRHNAKRQCDVGDAVGKRQPHATVSIYMQRLNLRREFADLPRQFAIGDDLTFRYERGF